MSDSDSISNVFLHKSRQILQHIVYFLLVFRVADMFSSQLLFHIGSLNPTEELRLLVLFLSIVVKIEVVFILSYAYLMERFAINVLPELRNGSGYFSLAYFEVRTVVRSMFSMDIKYILLVVIYFVVFSADTFFEINSLYPFAVTPGLVELDREEPLFVRVVLDVDENVFS